MHLFWLLSLCFISYSHIYANEQLMVCKPLNSAFEASQTNATFHGCSNPTGKAGKQGPRGLPVRILVDDCCL